MSRRIRAVAFVLAVLVVPIHCTTYKVSEWLQTQNVCAIAYWGGFVQNLVCGTFSRIAVPFFFLLSGFLMVKDFQPRVKWWADCIKRRIPTLLLPYLLWNVVYFAFKLALRKYSLAMPPWEVLKLLVGWPLGGELPCGQFWYIRCLFVYLLILPLFCLMCRSLIAGGMAVVVLASAWLVGFQGFGLQAFETQNFASFCFGVFAGLHGDELMAKARQGWLKHAKRSLWLLCFAAIPASLAFAYLGVESGWWAARRVMLLSGLFALCLQIATDETSGASIHPRLGSLFGLSFFIYAIHVIFTSLMYRISTLLNMGEFNRQITWFILRVFVSAAISIAMGLVVRRYFPRLYALLSGGRG